MHMEHTVIYQQVESPLGPLLVACCEHGVCRIGLPGVQPQPDWIPVSQLPFDIVRKLQNYFAGSVMDVDVPLHLQGSAFELKVWLACKRIPYGQTATYGQLAKLLGQPGAARAVGGALSRNPIPLLVPCHRVMGANGKLTGYTGGAGVETKAFLLQLEAQHLQTEETT